MGPGFFRDNGGSPILNKDNCRSRCGEGNGGSPQDVVKYVVNSKFKFLGSLSPNNCFTASPRKETRISPGDPVKTVKKVHVEFANDLKVDDEEGDSDGEARREIPCTDQHA